VAVGSDEIECRALQSGLPHARLPREDMQRQPKFDASLAHTRWRFTVHVDLPRVRSKRSKIVNSSRKFDPGQAISAVQMPCTAGAQRAVAIMNPGLRYGTKEKAALRTETK